MGGVHYKRYSWIIYSNRGSGLQLKTLPVLTFYYKEACSGSRHAWQASTPAVSTISYLVVQAFENMTKPGYFRFLHQSKAGIRVNTFLHLGPSTHFPCRLQGEVQFVDTHTVFRKKLLFSIPSEQIFGPSVGVCPCPSPFPWAQISASEHFGAVRQTEPPHPFSGVFCHLHLHDRNPPSSYLSSPWS